MHGKDLEGALGRRFHPHLMIGTPQTVFGVEALLSVGWCTIRNIVVCCDLSGPSTDPCLVEPSVACTLPAGVPWQLMPPMPFYQRAS